MVRSDDIHGPKPYELMGFGGTIMSHTAAVTTPKIDDFWGRLLEIRVFGPLGTPPASAQLYLRSN